LKISNKAEKWKQLISEYRSSGLTAKAWCELNQKSIHKLRYWITQFNKEKSSGESGPQWFSFSMQEHDTLNSPIILKIGTITIEVAAGFYKNVLVNVLSVVQNYDRCNQF